MAKKRYHMVKKILDMIILNYLMYVCRKSVQALKECLFLLKLTCRVIHTEIALTAINTMNLVACAIPGPEQMKIITILMKMVDWSIPIT